MVVRVYGAAVHGIDGVQIGVEVDLSNGLPAFDIVGLPDSAVREARERVRAAIKNSGFQFPMKRITVNLAPADQRKEGSALDLAIAVGILAADGQIRSRIAFDEALLIGELALDGSLKAVRGTLAMGLLAKAHGHAFIVVPEQSRREAALVGHPAYLAPRLADVVRYFEAPHALPLLSLEADDGVGTTSVDFADVVGQPTAKRALWIAAAGFHHALLIGPPGSGKTMLAARVPSIMPPLDEGESLEVTKIYDAAGVSGQPADGGLMSVRPFRAPHHTITVSGLIGGGNPPRPGEATLAHHGVLFLDELPEFSRRALEVLRQPLESGAVWLGRSRGSVVFPAKFLFIGSMNPCPCGFYGFEDAAHRCVCGTADIHRYRRKISGPIADRIDLIVDVPRVSATAFLGDSADGALTSAAMREAVLIAVERQRHRFRDTGIRFNAEMDARLLRTHVALRASARRLLEHALENGGLSARGASRVLKVARTIADLDDGAEVRDEHLAEALAFRDYEWTS
ncbi:MAG: YifB family Mg chelatase-like AAA ATPase [Hydrogenibacillus sp.]|nr:YifB family Mg chelatase-like AAA ATPase [Hydrogenibacillus sp.]